MSVLRNVISQADNTPAVTAEIKEALALLMKLAEAKAQQFKSAIETDLTTGKMGDTLEVSITKVLGSRIEFRAVVQSDLAGIAGKIAESLTPMFSGTGDTVTKVINGVASIVDDALKAIMGAGEGTETEVQSYAITTEYPAIVRFDFAFWGRNIAAESIKKYAENAFACVAYKSAVDITKLDYNTFLAVYAPVLNRAFGDDPKTLDEMISKARDIYKQFNPKALEVGVMSVGAPPQRAPAFSRITTRRATQGAF